MVAQHLELELGLAAQPLRLLPVLAVQQQLVAEKPLHQLPGLAVQCLQQEPGLAVQSLQVPGLAVQSLQRQILYGALNPVVHWRRLQRVSLLRKEPY